MKIVTLDNGHAAIDLGVTMEELESIRVNSIQYGFTPIHIQFPAIEILGLKTSFSGNERPYIFSLPKGLTDEKASVKSSRLRDLP